VDKICDSCRKKLSTVSEFAEHSELLDYSHNLSIISENERSSESTECSPEKNFPASVVWQSREKTNEYLRGMGVTQRKLQSRKYQKKKVETITRLQMSGINEKISADSEIIAQL
jgi:hypothetical protein